MTTGTPDPAALSPIGRRAFLRGAAIAGGAAESAADLGSVGYDY